MTDIKRHLSRIVKIIRPLVAASGDDIRTALRAALPASYIVGAGSIAGQDGAQAQADIIIADSTVAAGAWPDGVFALPQVLAVVTVAARHDATSLATALDAVARVKALRGAGRQTKAGLPLGILIFGTLDTVTDSDTAVMTMHAALAQQPPEQRPNYIVANGYGVNYRDPQLDGSPLGLPVFGFARDGDHPKPRRCYICKQDFSRRHFFYDQFCVRCGDLNYIKRRQTADLRGRIALVTGGRIKIGYAAALRLLRAGAAAIVTTRFPHDAARRYATEPDFGQWAERLHIYGLDLRHTPSVEGFTDYLRRSYPHLDILINNAAQTIRRPPAFYAHLLDDERLPVEALPAPLRPLVARNSAALPNTNRAASLSFAPSLPFAAALSQIPHEGDYDPAHFPQGDLDPDGQQRDLRPQTSWTQRLDEIGVAELLEVQLANVVAPTVLVSRLKPMMAGGMAFIVNVTALEGQFATAKRGHHPHTNMAKAALNMLTHSCAADYARSGIYMNSVDPGWVSQQVPQAQTDTLPLDLDDAAARICDPIFRGIATGAPDCGLLLKDYVPTAW